MYDVVVVGAGPAGGQCARELAYQKKKVLLIDKAKDFQENNYSSGGAPLNIMEEFALPSSIVGTYWNQLTIVSTHENATWTNQKPLGPVLNFDSLRQFLTDETISKGGECLLGCQYQSHQVQNDSIEVQLKSLNTGVIRQVRTRLIVDATGTDRHVIDKMHPKDHSIAMTGIEYHIQVEKKIYERYANSLHFFLGHQWMPQGYAWIFPMSNNQLKIGVIRYFQNKQYVPFFPSYKHYLDQLLSLCGNYEVLDKHGKTIHYTKRQGDKRQEGPILAIGDAVSAVNPLGCEGIRHALVTGRIAARQIDQFLNGKRKHFFNYEKELNRYFGRRWFFSELFMKSLFTTKNDKFIDLTVRSFSLMNNQTIMKVIFDYKFSYTIKSYLFYFLLKIKAMFTR